MDSTTTRRRGLKAAAVAAGAIVAVAVLGPTGALADGATFLVDPFNADQKARVTDGRLWVSDNDPNQVVRLYRTQVGAVSMAAGTSKHVANVSTAGYSQIRIVATERVGSVSNISFRVTILEGSELVAHLAKFTLSPQSSKTFVLDVPARAVAIYADAAAGNGNDAFDFLVYGSR